MNNPKIRVIIADDHTLFREGLALIINSCQDFELVLDVAHGQALLDALATKSNLPDVVLLDLKMPIKDGIETCKELKANYPDIKVVILTMLEQDDYILHMLDRGVNGYLLKNSSASEVRNSIKKVVEKDFYFSDHVVKVMLSGLKRKRKAVPVLNSTAHITEREQEVLQLLCREMTTAEIAEKLFVSVRTVETHRKHLMEKLGAKNTAGIVYRALKEGILD